MAGGGWLSFPYDERGIALETRIGHHLDGIAAVLDACNETMSATPILIGGWPATDRLRSEGLGAFLAPPR